MGQQTRFRDEMARIIPMLPKIRAVIGGKADTARTCQYVR
jgi:hypothetical protein